MQADPNQPPPPYGTPPPTPPPYGTQPPNQPPYGAPSPPPAYGAAPPPPPAYGAPPPPPARPGPRTALFVIIGAVALCLLGGAAVALVAVFAVLNTVPKTVTPPTAIRVPTVRSGPTLSAPDAAVATVTTLKDNASRVYGPGDGTLLHSGNNEVPFKSAQVDLRDFIAEADFANPYEATTDTGWDYGFIFRETDPSELRLYATSDGEWAFRLVNITSRPPGLVPVAAQVDPTQTPLGAGAIKALADGTVANLDMSAGGSNTLRLAAIGSTGYFFVNGEYVTTLDLSPLMDTGDVRLATAFRVNNNNPGQSTAFRNFNVWSLEK